METELGRFKMNLKNIDKGEMGIDMKLLGATCRVETKINEDAGEAEFVIFGDEKYKQLIQEGMMRRFR